MTLKAIEKALELKESRNWDKIYIAIDIHDTIVEGNYKTNSIPTEFYPFAKETLQALTKREDVKLILFTSSHPHEIQRYIKFFEENEIHFDYLNENTDVYTDTQGYGNYDKKFYFNVLIDDKAGFDPKLEWESIYWFLKPQNDNPYIIKYEPIIKVIREYNPNYGDDKKCICGHPYYRHFDTYEKMSVVGCKYCQCGIFVDASTLKVEAELICHSGTTYNEIWDFINQHQNKRAKIHYELKGYTTWGNDDEEVIFLDEYGLFWLNDYMGTESEYRNNSAYIHKITIYS